MPSPPPPAPASPAGALAGQAVGFTPNTDPANGTLFSLFNAPGLPAYVGLPAAQSVYLFPGYQGAAYLGPAFNPFDVNTAQKYLAASHTGPVQKPQCLENFGGDSARTQSRVDLLTQLDGFRRDLDRVPAHCADDVDFASPMAATG